MRLMEILSEVKAIEAEMLLEKKKKTRVASQVQQKIESSLKKKAKRSEKIATALKARKGHINWDASEEAKEVRNEIVAAFMANDADATINLLKDVTKANVAIEVLKALETAHGGYTKLEAAASKAGKKDFISRVYGYLDELDIEEDNKDK